MDLELDSVPSMIGKTFLDISDTGNVAATVQQEETDLRSQESGVRSRFAIAESKLRIKYRQQLSDLTVKIIRKRFCGEIMGAQNQTPAFSYFTFYVGILTKYLFRRCMLFRLPG